MISDKFYKNGELDGSCTTWFENGQKQFEYYYEEGWREGLRTEWYENGKKKCVRPYKDGVTNGILTKWYESGEKLLEERYNNGHEQSLTSWYENGQKHIQTYYKWVEHEFKERLKGGRIDNTTMEVMQKEGLHTEWDEDGNIICEKNFVGGNEE
jgi:antitoxin component YwqK of YwqJK toxin-antitoxin module